jgi:hypothetical protein
MKLMLWILAGSVALAASGLEAPAIGYGRADDGRIVRISGISGALIVDAAGEDRAVSVAFSGGLLFEKLESSIRVDGQQWDAPQGNALFGFSADGSSGVVFYPSSRELKVRGHGQWQHVPFDVGAEVLAVSLAGPASVRVLVARDQLELIQVRLWDGAIEDSAAIGHGTGPALLMANGGILYTRDGKTLYRRHAGVEHELDLPAPVTALSFAGRGWIQAGTESGRCYLIRLEPDVRVSELPEVAQ